MNLFSASSLFNEKAMNEIMGVVNDSEKLRERLIWVKETLLRLYNFKAVNVPGDFEKTSYVVATNHLTDSDAPLILSFYYDRMKRVLDRYPQMFVFAKENCFNGVSIPKELMPILEMEKIIAVDRNKHGGSMAAMKSAVRWFAEGEQPKHFLIFAQGTIYDINRDNAADIEQGTFWLARMLGIPVLPAFIEQAVEGEENRLVFGEPFSVPKTCRDFDEYKQLWLDRVIKAQDDLEDLTGVPARPAALDAAHQIRKRFR